MLRQKKAQGTLEYIIIFTAIVAAILVVANGTVKEKITSMLTHATTQADKAVGHIDFE